jgi:hypothetical protein
MPSSITYEDLLDTCSIRASELVVSTRKWCSRGWLGTTESSFIFSLGTVPVTVANPFVRNTSSVTDAKELV